jgi:hypothetical protein
MHAAALLHSGLVADGQVMYVLLLLQRIAAGRPMACGANFYTRWLWLSCETCLVAV